MITREHRDAAVPRKYRPDVERSNHRARSRRIPLHDSHETSIEEEVADALAATPEERIEAMVAVLDSAFALWAVRGVDRSRFTAAFPASTDVRRLEALFKHRQSE